MDRKTMEMSPTVRWGQVLDYFWSRTQMLYNRCQIWKKLSGLLSMKYVKASVCSGMVCISTVGKRHLEHNTNVKVPLIRGLMTGTQRDTCSSIKTLTWSQRVGLDGLDGLAGLRSRSGCCDQWLLSCCALFYCHIRYKTANWFSSIWEESSIVLVLKKKK